MKRLPPRPPQLSFIFSRALFVPDSAYRLLLAVILVLSAAVAVHAQNTVENNIGVGIWMSIHIVPTTCTGSPTSLLYDCLQVPSNTTVSISVPSGDVIPRVKLYCSTPCTTQASSLACTAQTSNFVCSGNTYTLEGDFVNNIFRIY